MSEIAPCAASPIYCRAYRRDRLNQRIRGRKADLLSLTDRVGALTTNVANSLHSCTGEDSLESRLHPVELVTFSPRERGIRFTDAVCSSQDKIADGKLLISTPAKNRSAGVDSAAYQGVGVLRRAGRRCRSGRFGQATGFLKAPSRLAENARRGCSESSLESRGMHTVSRHVRDTGDRHRRFLAASEKKPSFAECTAIAPATARDVGALFRKRSRVPLPRLTRE